MADAATNAQCADLLNRAGVYFHGRAAYSEARPLFERALAIREKVLGPEHPDTATSLNNLARLLQDQSDITGARPLYERALAICEKVLGPEHPDTARSSQPARRFRTRATLQEHGRFRARAGDPREGARPRASRYGGSLNNLARLLQDQGDLAEARPLYERALAIHEKVLGPEHPHTATVLNNLALLLRDEGDLAGAGPLFERALAIREKMLGPEHPDTATNLNNLARLFHDKGDFAVARPLFERALVIREKVLGPEHHDTAALSNLAKLLITNGTLKRLHALTRRLFECMYRIAERSLVSYCLWRALVRW